jgi:hypothetical protein
MGNFRDMVVRFKTGKPTTTRKNANGTVVVPALAETRGDLRQLMELAKEHTASVTLPAETEEEKEKRAKVESREAMALVLGHKLGRAVTDEEVTEFMLTGILPGTPAPAPTPEPDRTGIPAGGRKK